MMSLALFAGGMPGPFEIILILFVILLLFGARKLPDLARSLGKSLSEFKKGREEGAKSLEEMKESVEESAGTKEENKSEKKEETTEKG